MADNAHGMIRAERVLPISSEQEALNLDEGSPFPVRLVPILPTTSIDGYVIAVSSFWKRHVTMSVSQNKCRDHLANERTALGYVRTGQAFAMLGVIISQLMRLMHSPTPDPVLGFFVISLPLSCMCHGMALVCTILGCYRYLHWQAEMARGYAISSGWEVITIFGLSFLALVCMLALVVGITIKDPNR